MATFLERINKIALQFLVPLTINQTYSLICREIVKLLKVHYCSIYLKHNDKLKKVYASIPELYQVEARKEGYTYKAFKTHRVYVANIEDFGKDYPKLQKMGIKSSVFIPLFYHKEAIGVLVLQSLIKKRFSKKELHTFEVLGSVASLAIRKAQFSQETSEAIKSRDQSREMENIMEKVYKAGLKFLVPLTPRETYSTIVKEALRLVGAQHGTMLIDENGQLNRVYSTSSVIKRMKPRRQGLVYKVFNSRKAAIIDTKELEKSSLEFRKLKIGFSVIAPLSYRNKSIGVLAVLSSKDITFTNKELNILKLFSPLASLAIVKTQLYDEARKALEVRDLFIALAAHELRTPLTTLNGYIYLLSSKFANKKSAESEWVRNLTYESRRLTHLIQELLEVNKMQAGTFQYIWRESSIRDIIQKALTNFSFSFPQHDLIFKDKLRLREDTVIGDFDKLVQLISNVLNNAAKFSPINKPIIVKLASRTLFYIITIHDEGVGITKEDQRKVFHMFYKGVKNMKEGFGLGLFLSKNIVETHQGSIKMSSSRDKGTTVVIKLPIAKV